MAQLDQIDIRLRILVITNHRHAPGILASILQYPRFGFMLRSIPNTNRLCDLDRFYHLIWKADIDVLQPTHIVYAMASPISRLPQNTEICNFMCSMKLRYPRAVSLYVEPFAICIPTLSPAIVTAVNRSIFHRMAVLCTELYAHNLLPCVVESPFLRSAENTARPELFLPDGLRLTASGYALILKAVLITILESNRSARSLRREYNQFTDGNQHFEACQRFE